ncbi:hypothetical protein ACHWQZ_G019171 [Mnemiopsis leidyi]
MTSHRTTESYKKIEADFTWSLELLFDISANQASSIKDNFTCNYGQIHFDWKLLSDLGGFGKVNRLAVVLVQEEENKILCITKTESLSERTEAETLKKSLDSWGIADEIFAVGFDTTSSNDRSLQGSLYNTPATP